MPDKTKDKENKVPCPLCKKTKDPHTCELKGTGNNVGNGRTLGHNIMKTHYGLNQASEHPFSVCDDRDYAQAHHLVCSEIMRSDEAWENICAVLGYDINHPNNGIFLPSDMRVACKLEIPLHRGNHYDTETEDEDESYVAGVTDMVEGVKSKAFKGDYCKGKGDIIKELDEISNDIWVLVKDFDWTLTADGHDYESGHRGCAGARTLPSKRELDESEECDRDHLGIIVVGKYFIEQGTPEQYSGAIAPPAKKQKLK